MSEEERHSWLSGYVPHAQGCYPGAPAVAAAGSLFRPEGLFRMAQSRANESLPYPGGSPARCHSRGDPSMPGCHSGAPPLPPVSFLCLKERSAQSFFQAVRNRGMAGKREQIRSIAARAVLPWDTRSVMSHRQAAPWPPGQSCVIRRHCMACWRCCSGLRPSTGRVVIRAQSSRTRRLRQLRVSASTTRQKAGPKGQAASSCSRS